MAHPVNHTRNLLVDAGIREGMRVLDIGCGRGEVTFLASPLVGTHGSVVGVDCDESALVFANQKKADLGFTNTSFVHAHLDALPSDIGLFDAIVCRRVLMYLQDPVATLRKIRNVLVPGGLIAMQEHDFTDLPLCSPPHPLHTKMHQYLVAAHKQGMDANTNMGLQLATALSSAGYTLGCVKIETTVLTATQSHNIPAICKMLAPRIINSGVATAEEIDVDTLEERMNAERMAVNGTLVWDLVCLVWARNSCPAV